MEFRSDLVDLLKSRAGKTNPDGSIIAKLLPFNVSNYKSHDVVSDVIDKMGDASAFAQGLHGTITTSSNFKISEYTLYLKVKGKQCLGFIKTGYKNLYVREYSTASMINIRPLCILDFYVHESCQREGHGKDLFDYVLQDQSIEPKMIAYDRPSHKYLSFLSKYYGLKNYFPQSNNFVLFDDYFQAVKAKKVTKAATKEEYPPMPQFNPYSTSSSAIGFKQRRGQGVFSALGSQMMTCKFQLYFLI